MHHVDEHEFRKKLSACMLRAGMETVVITEAGVPSLVMLSWEVFSQLRRGNRQALKIEALSEEDITTIAAAKLPRE